MIKTSNLNHCDGSNWVCTFIPSEKKWMGYSLTLWIHFLHYLTGWRKFLNKNWSINHISLFLPILFFQKRSKDINDLYRNKSRFFSFSLLTPPVCISKKYISYSEQDKWIKPLIFPFTLFTSLFLFTAAVWMNFRQLMQSSRLGNLERLM